MCRVRMRPGFLRGGRGGEERRTNEARRKQSSTPKDLVRWMRMWVRRETQMVVRIRKKKKRILRPLAPLERNMMGEVRRGWWAEEGKRMGGGGVLRDILRNGFCLHSSRI